MSKGVSMFQDIQPVSNQAEKSQVQPFQVSSSRHQTSITKKLHLGKLTLVNHVMVIHEIISGTFHHQWDSSGFIWLPGHQQGPCHQIGETAERTSQCQRPHTAGTLHSVACNLVWNRNCSQLRPPWNESVAPHHEARKLQAHPFEATWEVAMAAYEGSVETSCSWSLWSGIRSRRSLNMVSNAAGLFCCTTACKFLSLVWRIQWEHDFIVL